MSRRFGLDDSAPRGSRWRRLILSRGRELPIVAIAVAALILVIGRLGFDDFLTSRISREDVERGGSRALLFSGGGVTSVSCPGELERKTGAKIVCTYTETAAEAVRAATQLEDPPPPRIGRVEIRITGWRTPGGIDTSSRPEFGARVIQQPR